jgi:hypothetical protein
MAALGLRHALVALAVAASTACSIWAAIDDPYKAEATGDSGARPPDAGTDADAEAGAVNRVVDAGFSPYAIAAYGDTVFVVDDSAQVHVAHDAGTTFESFWTGDGGDTFVLTNKIAASDAGVFWTVGTPAGTGIRYCALDGGACGFLQRGGKPGVIAASDSVVAWAVTGNIESCPTTAPLSACTPALRQILPTVSPSIAVGPDGTIAWVSGGTIIRFDGPRGRSMVNLGQYTADVVATDAVTGNLYWEGQDAVGYMAFDGTGSTISPLQSGAKPTQLFAANGTVFWSLLFTTSPTTIVSYCQFDSDAGCAPRQLLPNVTGKSADNGLIANSREVMTAVSYPVDSFPGPELVVWRSPYAPPGM